MIDKSSAPFRGLFPLPCNDMRRCDMPKPYVKAPDNVQYSNQIAVTSLLTRNLTKGWFDQKKSDKDMTASARAGDWQLNTSEERATQSWRRQSMPPYFFQFVKSISLSLKNVFFSYYKQLMLRQSWQSMPHISSNWLKIFLSV